jgi:hypothetical protein
MARSVVRNKVRAFARMRLHLSLGDAGGCGTSMIGKSLSLVISPGTRTNRCSVSGGTAQGVARAQRDSWPRILDFLTQAASAASP